MVSTKVRSYTAGLHLTLRLLPILAVLLALGAGGCGHDGSLHSRILFMSDRDGDWALYVMDANGSDQQRVFPAGRADPFGEGVSFGEPAVSPDGRRVLLARQGVTVATLATGASTRIGAGEESSAGWSPDSTRVVFSGPEDNGLYVVDLSTGRRRALLATSQTWTPSWSPDGQWIAFSRQIGYGPTEVYAAHPDGSGLRWLTDYAPGGGGGLAWSRDGRLAFIGSRGSEQSAHLVIVDVHRGRVDVMRPKLQRGAVAWSPDGKTLAYAAASGNSEASTIFTVDADGSSRRQLTPPRQPYSDTSPIWSPDGKTLLFVRTPAGGGVERYVPEVWTMRFDGSQRRPLTEAYPDGGENLEPAWIHGAVHTESAPRPQEGRRGKSVVLRVPFAVDGIAAEGARAAIAPVAYEMQAEYEPTPPVLLWRPGRGAPARVVASPCGGVQQLVLAANRLAFDCNNTFLDLIEQSLWVVDERTRLPREVFSSHAGPANQGLYLDNIVGGDGLLAFGSQRRGAQGKVLRRMLWRIEGFDSIALRSSPGTGEVVAAGEGRLAVESPNGHIAILSANGTPLHLLSLPRRRSGFAVPFGVDPKPQFLLAGRDLLRLDDGTLAAYDTATGKVRWERRVPPGAQLEGADGGLVVYTVGSSIHLLAHGRESVVHTHALRLPRLRDYVYRVVHAALTREGLYYSFNVADRRYPGRVMFVPRSALPG